MTTLLIVNGYGLSNADLYSKIASTENLDTVVIFTPYDPYPEFLWGYSDTVSLQSYCTSSSISLSVIGCSPLHYYDARFADLRCVDPWTTFFATSVIAHSLANNITPLGHQLPIKKLFTSLNSKPRHNRCMFIDYMSHYNLIDNNYVSWNMTLLEPEANNKPYIFKYWTPERLVLETAWQNTNICNPSQPVQNTPPLQFSDSLFSFVSETVTDEIMVTEKTWVAIYHQRPFLTFATTGYYKFLQELGIELYDEVFDYNFDSILNWERRCAAVMQEMKKLENTNLQDLYMSLRPKVLRNYTRMLDIVKNGIGRPNILDAHLTNDTTQSLFGHFLLNNIWKLDETTELLDLYRFSDDK